MDIQEVFKKNLEFISKTELDAELTNNQFTKTKTRDYVTIGTVDLPSGKIRVGDPLAYMCIGRFTPELDKTVKPGSYPVEIAVIDTAFDTVRLTASRIKLSDEKAVRYELAKPTHETTVMKCRDGDVTGFPVDAGTMGFMDSAVMEEYAAFIDEWHKENPDKNHYDDYFSDFFAESYEKFPQYQRAGGDFIEWTVPGTNHRLVMNSTGFGDGFYQIYWGIDKSGEICEVTVPLINADLLDEANKEYLDIWDGNDACLVTKHIAEGGGISYASREEINNDSGWYFFGFDENQEYWNNSDNYTLYSLHLLAKRFPKLIPLLHSPVGTAYFGTKDGDFIPDKDNNS